MNHSFKRIFIKISKIFGIVVLVFLFAIGLLSLIVYANKTKIYNQILTYVNQQIEGEIEISDIRIAPFKNFPYMSVDLKQTVLFSDKSIHKDTLLHIEDAYIGFDVLSLLKGNYTVKKISLESGHIDIVKDSLGEFGIVNALKTKESATIDSTSASVDFKLNEIVFKDMRVEERNEFNHNYFDLTFKYVKASISQVVDIFAIELKGDFLLNHFIVQNVTYFKNKPFSLDTEIHLNQTESVLSILPGTLQLAYGSLDFEGSLKLQPALYIDVELKGRKQSFDVFVSLLPDAIMEDLRRFKTNGDIFFDGRIHGYLVDASPAVDFTFGCENTVLTESNSNHSIKDIAFKGAFSTGENNTLASSYFKLTNLYGKPEHGIFKGTFLIQNFENPIVQMEFKADLDLQDLGYFYKVKGLKTAKGNVNLNLVLNEYADADSVIHVASKLSDGTKSSVIFKNVTIEHDNLPHTISNLNGLIAVNNDDLLLDNLSLIYGKSDLALKASIQNVIAYVHGYDAPVAMSLHGESKALFAANFTNDTAQIKPLWYNEVVRNLVFDLDINAKSSKLKNFILFPEADIYCRKLSFSLDNYPHPLQAFYAKIQLSDNLLSLDPLTIKIGENDLAVKGHVFKPYALIDSTSNSRVVFDLHLESNSFNAKELLKYKQVSLINPEIDSLLDSELLSKVVFDGNGHFYPNSLKKSGTFVGEFDILQLQGKFNQFPALGKTKGKIVFEKNGTVRLRNFKTQLGKSDFYGDLYFSQSEEDIEKNTTIKGNLGGKFWDIDELNGFNSQDNASKSNGNKSTVDHDAGFNIFELPFPIARLDVHVEKLNYHKYKLSNLNFRARTDKEHRIHLDTCGFYAADGYIGLKGVVDGNDKSNIFAKLSLDLVHVNLNQMFYKLDNFGQDFLIQDNVSGFLTAHVNCRAKLHTDMTIDMSDMNADMDVKVENGFLKNFAPMHAMAEFLGNKNFDNIKFGLMENKLNFRNGRLNIPQMQLNSSLGYIKLAGMQNMTEYMEYEIQVPLSLVRQAGWNMVKSKLLRSKSKSSEKEMQDVEQEIISSQSGVVKGYLTFTMVSVAGSDFDVKIGKSNKLK